MPAAWAALVALSLLLGWLLELARLPAALLLAAMGAGILVRQAGQDLRVPPLAYAFAQAVIGLMVGRMFTPDLGQAFMRHWALFPGVMLVSVATSAGLGYLFARWRVLPGTTAIWGLLPGAASTMMVMAEAYGADMALVAFMQYARVLAVAAIASIVARWLAVDPMATIGSQGWFPAVDPWGLVATLAVALACLGVGLRSRIPAGVLLLAMLGGGALHMAGLLTIVLPPWLLVGCYMALGWTVGLRFTRQVLLAAWRALPQTLLSIALLLGTSGLLALALLKFAGVDPLTAFLATSPGGADSAAIIAAATHVDASFVMTLQLVRVLVVMALGPALSRYLAGRLTA